MRPYLQLIRIPGLLFIALTLLLMRQAVIVPILQVYGFEPTPPGMRLGLLIAATLCIAAGGYILNDYFNVKADAVNRPGRLVITRQVSKESAMRLYQVLTGAGIVCGLLLAWLCHSFTLAFILIVTPGLLWFYASNYQRQFLVGNVVIAFCAALVPLTAAISEMGFLQATYGELLYTTPIPTTLYGWTTGFAADAFLLTWILAFVHDLENAPGDREMEYRTLPVKWGMRRGNVFLCCLVTLTCITLYLAGHLCVPFEGTLTLRYILFGQIVPLVLSAVLAARAKQPADYRQAAYLVWFALLAGVLYSIVFYYLQAKTHGISLFGLFVVQ